MAPTAGSFFGRFRSGRQERADPASSGPSSLPDDRPARPGPSSRPDNRPTETGLFRISRNVLDGAFVQDANTVDIIAVHGLGGDAYNTWTNANGKFWLEDVAGELPGARIFTYGYNSLVFSRSTSNLRDFARTLLELIRLERTSLEQQARGIIFVCHSMGGLVVKQALIFANSALSKYDNIKDSVAAILFLGTPHQGSPAANYATVLAGIVDVAFTGPQALLMTGALRTDLVKLLKREGEELLRLAEDFQHLTKGVQITSFIEQNTMQGWNERIVDDYSGYLGATDERKIPLEGNHREICKPPSRTSMGYRLILGGLKEGIASRNRATAHAASAQTSVVVMPQATQAATPLLGLPPGSPRFLVPRNVNPLFIGRHTVLEKLEKAFPISPDAQRPPHSARVFVIIGLGGTGKSEICLKYITEHRNEFWGVFWITASDATNAEKSFLAIGKSCNAHVGSVQDVKTWLANTKERWLLIVDNADDPNLDYNEYLPPGNGNIIITSRLTACDMYNTVGCEDLANLEPGEAVELLFRACATAENLREAKQSAAAAVVEALGSHTLAIVQAGAYIRQQLCTLEEYPEDFRKRKDALLRYNAPQSKSDYKNVYATFEVSAAYLKKSEEQDATDALELLHILAFMHFDGISEQFFQYAAKYIRRINEANPNYISENINWLTSKHVEYLPEYLRQPEHDFFDKYRWRRACSTLAYFSLVTMQTVEGFIHLSMHPLIHQWAETRQSPETRTTTWLAAASVLALATEGKWSNHVLLVSLHPHITACVGHSVEEYVQDSPPLEIAQLLWQFSWLLYFYRDAISAEGVLHIVKPKLIKLRLDEDGETWLAVKRFQSFLYIQQGDHEKAVNLLEEIVKSRKTMWNDGDSKMLKLQGELAEAYVEVDTRRGDGIAMLKEVVRKQKATLDSNDGDRLRSLHSLASAYMKPPHENYNEAIILLEEVVRIRDVSLPADGPSRLGSMHELARAYLGSGQNYDRAVDLLEEVVCRRKKTLHVNHPRRLASMHRLATAYLDSGQKYEDAIVLLEEVVRIQKTVLRAEDPDRLGSMYSLATAYLDSGQRYEDAIVLLEEVVRIQKTVLRAEDPGRLVSMHTLATTYLNSGQRYEDAIVLLEEVVRIGKTVLRAEDPNRLGSMYRLATAYRKAGLNQDEAVRLMQEVVRIWQDTLAVDDLNLLNSQLWLADAYLENDQSGKALQLLEVVVKIRQPEGTYQDTRDGDITWGQELLARAYLREGQNDEAVEHFQKTFDLEQKYLLPNDPKLLNAQLWLADAYLKNNQNGEALQLLEVVVKIQQTEGTYQDTNDAYIAWGQELLAEARERSNQSSSDLQQQQEVD